jgi:hypothetical protein
VRASGTPGLTGDALHNGPVSGLGDTGHPFQQCHGMPQVQRVHQLDHRAQPGEKGTVPGRVEHAILVMPARRRDGTEIPGPYRTRADRE